MENLTPRPGIREENLPVPDSLPTADAATSAARDGPIVHFR
jgi:hypothetical protein